MYLAKLFIIIGVLLVAQLVHTEGRRRWFKRTGERIRCDEGNQITNGTIPEGDRNAVEGPRNCTDMGYRRFGKWHKMKCATTKSVEGDLPAVPNSTSNEREINLERLKISRRSKFGRRMKWNRRQWKCNNVTSNQSLNAANSDVASDNEKELPITQGCRGRFACRPKCQNSEVPVIQVTEEGSAVKDQSNVNTAVGEDLPKIEEPIQNIN